MEVIAKHGKYYVTGHHFGDAKNRGVTVAGRTYYVRTDYFTGGLSPALPLDTAKTVVSELVALRKLPGCSVGRCEFFRANDGYYAHTPDNAWFRVVSFKATEPLTYEGEVVSERVIECARFEPVDTVQCTMEAIGTLQNKTVTTLDNWLSRLRFM
jgi:hypothetical protein